MRKGYIGFGLLLIPILVFGVLLGFNAQESETDSSTSIKYDSMVCSQIIRADGTTESPYCSHNQFLNTGANITRDILGNGAVGAPFKNITLCNATAGCGVPTATSAAQNVFTTCGLSSAEGTYSVNTASAGNWTISKQFTASCADLVTNVTYLENVTGTDFAGMNFPTVTLQSADQLTVNWTIWVA